MAHSRRSRWWSPGWLAFGVALLAAATHLWLIQWHGSDQPFHDQWGAEGFVSYRPWLHGELTPAYFFFPHSEHHPAATRLLAWAEFAVNDQWDARVQMVVNTALYALVALVPLLLARSVMSGRMFVAVALLGAVLLAQPACFENALWGFQSQFYFLLLFSWLHVWGTAARERPDLRWAAAQLAGIAALFTIAAGVASAAALALLAVLELVRRRRTAWAWWTLAVNGSLIAAALWMLPSVPGAHAHSLGQLLRALGYLLAWPWPTLFGLGLAAPWVVLAIAVIRARDVTSQDRVVFAVGLWAWLMLASLAYGRGDTPGRIAIRYFDLIVVHLFANALALARVSRQAGRPRLMAGMAAGWAVIVLAGIWSVNRPSVLGPLLRAQDTFFEKQARAVRAFLVTNDPADLTRDPVVRRFLPHLDFTVQVLRDPAMRSRLPPSLVPPLTWRIDAERSRGFCVAPNGEIGNELPPVGSERRLETEPIVGGGRPILRFGVRGRLGRNGSELLLRGADGQVYRPIGDANVVAPDRWRTVQVCAPRGSFRVVAITPAGAGGLEITPPIEVGWLSWLAPKAAEMWPFIGALGAACVLWGALAGGWTRREKP